MKICINKVYNRIALIKNINIITSCGLVKAKHIVNDIMQGTKVIIDIPDEYLIIFKQICQFTTESKRYNMKKHQFKPFDQVLVRTANCIWKVDFFSHINTSEYGSSYCCITGNWEECILYNENTAHLVGTAEPYKEPEPKVWKVTCYKNNEVFHFTNDELKYFIENAVINNKDVQWFTITYVGNDN